MSFLNSSPGSPISIINLNDSENDTDEESPEPPPPRDNWRQENPLKCGEILLHKGRIHFKCNFCGNELNNVVGFLGHMLKLHLIIDENDADAIMIEALEQFSTHDDGITRRKVQLVDDREVLPSLEPLPNASNSQVKLSPMKEKKDSELEFYEEFEILEEISGDEHVIEQNKELNEMQFEIELLEETTISPQIKSESSPEAEFKVPQIRKNQNTKRKQTTSENGSFSCNVCQKNFKTKILLNVHMKRHSAQKPFACKYCDAHFTDNSNLKVHINRHLGIKPHTCSICSKGFASTTELKLHMRSHTGEKPYVCEECGQRFSNSGHLSAHRRRHYNDRPYQCATCGKDFFDRRLLRDHEAGHSGIRPYECNICGTTFTRRKALTEHAKLHSGIRKYACKICDKAFAQNAGLWSHMKQHQTSKSP